jgi:ubiquinone/menaquinone biosynthesis C-methylase UbiE
MLEPWVPALLKAVRLQSGERVLDIACGTGFVARQAAECVGAAGTVTGVDINVGMLAMAKAATANNAALVIDWREADVSALPFPDGSFDVALCQQGLQFFPDRLGALQEIRRILVPGGRIGLSVWGSLEENPYFLAVEVAIRRHVSDDAASGLRKPHALADPEEVRAAITKPGFEDADVYPTVTYMCTPPAREFLPGHLSALPVAGEIAALPENARAALIEDLYTALIPYADEDGLRLPGVVHMVTARVPG